MFEMFYFQDEVQIDDISKMFYDDFVEHEAIFYIETNLSKKQLRYFRKKMDKKSFYPIHIVRKSKQNMQVQKQTTLNNSKKSNEDLFIKRYQEVAKQQFNVESLFEIKDSIQKCPFCKTNSISLTHNYSQEYTDCDLYIQCSKCKRIIDRKCFFWIIDAEYTYNHKIKRYLDIYCKKYPNEFIAKKIFDELENTQTISYMGCI